MKILVVCQYYFPEPFRISDICEELVQRGHEVTVITGLPNYPMGKIYKGYEHREKRDEVINGVHIHRCYTIERKTGAIHRFLNYYSYAISSSHFAAKLKEDYDVVFVNQLSPVMMANAGIKYKKKHHKKLVLYCLDLWPESLVAGGIKRGSFIYKIFHHISEKIYKSADRILVTSHSFLKYFEAEFGIKDTEYLPQYAESIFGPEQCAKKPNNTFDLMFAGNIGAAQSVKTIIEAANLTKDIPNLRWHIVGDGSELENVKQLAKQYDLSSVIFHGRQPLEKMPEYYAMADAMLVTMQKDPVLSLTLPGKVQTYMAAGKPIIGAIDGETANVIAASQCGLCGQSESSEELMNNVRTFIYENRKSCPFAHSARDYYLKHFSKSKYLDSLEDCFKREIL
ncbi:MAG: glycosyltransferase family 4 protein [Clostridiales bacterium]|jgi:glycosyltransferase involved in cell wall biosynthesis|nr:glycosyltransferase family 4 protein [Clostridiales bacterium]MCI1962098.1 glycosyltransferase family 4 protein [Clostridiales bacterium]MCI2022540.1 glycosyltransferase family 4 protein [Clostridiales bacterium]MCI2027145.1 glycosyltransferase family 4 protein [Clostridiales bacterium]